MSKTAIEDTNEYAIEKGISIPETLRLGRSGKYPFREMNKVDSFLARRDSNKKSRHPVPSAVSYFTKRNGGKFTCRAVEGGVRVWCLERVPPIPVEGKP